VFFLFFSFPSTHFPVPFVSFHTLSTYFPTPQILLFPPNSQLPTVLRSHFASILKPRLNPAFHSRVPVTCSCIGQNYPITAHPAKSYFLLLWFLYNYPMNFSHILTGKNYIPQLSPSIPPISSNLKPSLKYYHPCCPDYLSSSAQHTVRILRSGQFGQKATSPQNLDLHRSI
jgi:hypothetical protein